MLRAIIASLSGEVTVAQMAAEADQAVTVLERVGDDAQLALDIAARQTAWLGRAAEATTLAERRRGGRGARRSLPPELRERVSYRVASGKAIGIQRGDRLSGVLEEKTRVPTL